MFSARICDATGSHPLMAVVARALRRVRMAGTAQGDANASFPAAVSAREFGGSCTCVVRYGQTRSLKKNLAIRVQKQPSPSLKSEQNPCAANISEPRIHALLSVGACDSTVCSASARYSAQQLCVCSASAWYSARLYYLAFCQLRFRKRVESIVLPFCRSMPTCHSGPVQNPDHHGNDTMEMPFCNSRRSALFSFLPFFTPSE